MRGYSHVLARFRRVAKQAIGRDLRVRPQIKVSSIRLGSDYGGWAICQDAGLGPGSLLYSFGVGDDISFDVAMIKRFGCNVVAFDPTPRSIEWLNRQHLPEKLQFYPWGLSGVDGFLPFAAPADPQHMSYSSIKTDGPISQCVVHRLSTIMQKLDHRDLDVLKMDIEGSEYDVIGDMEAGTLRPRQILVEFHHGMYGVSIAQTERAITTLNSMGYHIFAISSTGREYSFLLQS